MAESGNRLRAYKNCGKDMEELRRKRTETSVELRKARKDNQLSKRRNLSMGGDDDALSPLSPLGDLTNKSVNNGGPLPLDMIATQLQSTEARLVHEAAVAVRRLLSRERSPPIDEVIKAGVLPRLVQCLKMHDMVELQLEAAWALTNVASGHSAQTAAVVSAGALQPFIQLLNVPDERVREQAVWALGNIAGDGAEMRDMCLKHNIIDPLATLIHPDTSLSFLRNLAWTLSNLCRNKNPYPKKEYVQKLIPALKLLLSHQDTEVVADACWAVSYLSDGPNDRIQMVVDSGLVKLLVPLLSSDEVSIVTPSLRGVGNVVTGSDIQTQYVLDSGLLQRMPALLSHSKSSVNKEAAWTLSNVTAGTQHQIQCVVDAKLLPQIVNIMNTADYKTQKEAAWALTNLTTGGTSGQIAAAVAAGAVSALCRLLVVRETKIVHVILDALTNILNAVTRAGDNEHVTSEIEECGGLDLIEMLQEHENEDVYQLALNLIDTFFNTEGDEAGNNVPATENGEYVMNVNAGGDSKQFVFH